MILFLSMLAGCSPETADLAAVAYTPLPGDDWQVSTPEEQGLDPVLVAKMYLNASELETIYSPQVINNGKLIAEDYFNEGSVDDESWKNEKRTTIWWLTSSQPYRVSDGPADVGSGWPFCSFCIAWFLIY